MLRKQSEGEKVTLVKQCQELRAALLIQSEEKVVLLDQCQEEAKLLTEPKKRNHNTSFNDSYVVDCRWLGYWNDRYRCAKERIDPNMIQNPDPPVGPPNSPCL